MILSLARLLFVNYKEAAVKRSVTLFAGLALMMPLISGCYAGQDAETKLQTRSGNGYQVSAEGMLIDNATIVAGNKGSNEAAFLGTLYNPTYEPDELLSITATDSEVTLTPEPLELPALGAVTLRSGTETQAALADFEASPGQYVNVTFTFRSAARTEVPVLVVAPYGEYVDAAPEGTDEALKEIIIVEEGSEGSEGETSAESSTE
ncbi:MAG: hypothetical protein CMH41_02795 [Micrococcales bacterium]|nr:hypothetical protein [Micrococcales bacterium]